MKQYDLVIIGGGAGAFAAAIKADELGAKTALINEGLPLGGTCVNVGCVPSKTLLYAAEVKHMAGHHSVPGVELAISKADYAAVVADELALVERLRAAKYERVLNGLSNVTHIKDRATFVSPHQVKAAGRLIETSKFIIATGSTATVPAIAGLKETGFITHVEAAKLKTVPKRLAVIGAGPTGLELGQLYARFGSQVTILQRNNNILPKAEPVITKRLREVMQAEGVRIHTGVSVTKVIADKGAKVIVYENGADTYRVRVDEVLLAAGKTPNTATLDLQAAGVAVDNNQAVVAKPSLQTSRPHIYAAGDVTNLPLRLETTSGKEGTYAAENAVNGSTKAIDYNAVPYTVFTDPAIAAVGYTEGRQLEELKACACRTLTFDKLPKALITKRTEGIIKVAIHPHTRVITGVHILAPNAGDLIAQAMVLVKNKNTIDELEEMLPVFPTLSEAIKLAAMSFTRDIEKMSCCI